MNTSIWNLGLWIPDAVRYTTIPSNFEFCLFAQHQENPSSVLIQKDKQL